MIVEVTEDDIREGERHECEHCPVARAINRIVGPKYRCSVDGSTVGYLANDPEDMWLPRSELPNIARDFVLDFDFSRPVHPITFEMLGPFE